MYLPPRQANRMNVNEALRGRFLFVLLNHARILARVCPASPMKSVNAKRIFVAKWYRSHLDLLDRAIADQLATGDREHEGSIAVNSRLPALSGPFSRLINRTSELFSRSIDPSDIRFRHVLEDAARPRCYDSLRQSPTFTLARGLCILSTRASYVAHASQVTPLDAEP